MGAIPPVTSATLIEKCCLIASPVAGNPTHFMVEQAFLLAGLDWRFMSFEVDPKELGDAMRGIRALGFRGVKVAEPHQVTVLEYLDELTDRARLCGSVNCVTSDGSRLLGDNTEGLALVDLVRSHMDLTGKKAMVIGSGRLARVIAVALAQAGVASIAVASRSPESGQRLGRSSRARPRPRRRSMEFSEREPIKIAGDVTLLVNASSLSTADPGAALPIELAGTAAERRGRRRVVRFAEHLAHAAGGEARLHGDRRRRSLRRADGAGVQHVDRRPAGQGRDARSGGRVSGAVALDRHVARTLHHRNGHGRRQDVRRRADCQIAARERASESASTSRSPAAASCATASWYLPTRWHSGKRPADRARSNKSARRCSPRRSRRISRPGPKDDASIPNAAAAGLKFWRESCDIVLVEGAGGLMSPMSDDDYNADLADEFGYPLVVVAANVLGTINATLQTLIVADTFREGLAIAGIVLNSPQTAGQRPEHRQQRRRTAPPLRAAAAWRK